MQIPRTAAASPARSSRLVLSTGCGAQHSSSHSALQAHGRDERTRLLEVNWLPPRTLWRSLPLYSYSLRDHGLFFPAATTSPSSWGSFRPRTGFRGGHRILQFLPNPYHAPDHAPDWPSSYLIAANANWEIVKVVRNKIIDEKADAIFLISKKLHF